MSALPRSTGGRVAELGPEVALLVELVRDAVAACRGGDREACAWLRLAAPGWLKLLCGDADPDAVHRALLAAAGLDQAPTPAPAGVQLSLWRE